jgi:post-segregation antitoxin (ccd killing protein)
MREVRTLKAIYDVDAPKRPVNLSLNEDLVARARNMTGNLSAEVESMLADFVLRQTQLHQAEARRLKRSAVAWNAFNERHGSFADEFSTL